MPAAALEHANVGLARHIHLFFAWVFLGRKMTITGFLAFYEAFRLLLRGCRFVESAQIFMTNNNNIVHIEESTYCVFLRAA